MRELVVFATKRVSSCFLFTFFLESIVVLLKKKTFGFLLLCVLERRRKEEADRHQHRTTKKKRWSRRRTFVCFASSSSPPMMVVVVFRLGRRSRDTERERESRRELSFVVSTKLETFCVLVVFCGVLFRPHTHTRARLCSMNARLLLLAFFLPLLLRCQSRDTRESATTTQTFLTTQSAKDG